MKRAFVTGASGRIGRYLVPILLEHDYRVKALVHQSKLPPGWDGVVEPVQVSLRAEKDLAEAMDDADVVCHLAALMPPASDDDMFDVNIEGTYRLLQAAMHTQNKPRFVFATSDATYCTGWSKGPYVSPIDENTEQHPLLLYGVSKVLGERMCFHYEDIWGIPTVRLRLVWILEAPEVLDLFVGAPYKEFLADEDRGKWDDPETVQLPLEEDGSPYFEHICDVRDAAQGVFLAMDRPEAPGQIFNIAGPAPYTYTEVAPWLAERMGRKAIPGHCKRIHSYEISIHKARSALGYRPKYSVYDSLEDALAQGTGGETS
jgi:UDP-glucose 4-epimerase